MESKIKEPTKAESRIIKFMILLGIFSILNFMYFFFQPEHRGNDWLFTLLAVTIFYSILKKLYMWYNYSNITIPENPGHIPPLKVDVLTTYYPGEPYQMTITTLEAIKKITYPHTTYLCDEANDPYLKQFCEDNGIIHVTRDNRINAKAGNINNALRKHATGDICVVLDPDHIPEPHFLDPILPHFNDPEIGFVQIVQSYYNIKETLVARGAAEQTFQFYGPMMMTLNSYGAVNAIGANCVFRRKALDSIGGHAPGLCEDMHTAMLMYSKGWKAKYLPEVLARGLAPSNLTNFYKQQLKWSRGTFDLLFKVYPRIFKKLSGRQKIHYGILPMHYLAGITILINFLIPILSLVFATTPWEGNIVDFLLVLLPVVVSSLLIRTFIQKWVIEKKERGFHLIGGLLHINTWWIYLIGFFYTIIDKKVPYLPTPKENEWNTNYKIIIPNLVVAFISIAAIIYGLSIDLTPYSLIMAGFAFFNACIMFFGVYLTHRVTNQNRLLRDSLKPKKLFLLWKARNTFFQTANATFVATRKIAWPFLLGILIFSMNSKLMNERARWETLEAPEFEQSTNRYLGIFHPIGEFGIPDIQDIFYIENQHNMDFDIISFYLAWNEESLDNFPRQKINATYDLKALPMITWEPWASGLPENLLTEELRQEKKVFKHITEGYFDDYIKRFAEELKSFDKPLFLRFAHEFDNPQYPWSKAGGNTPEEFIAAWKYVYNAIKEQGASNVIFVWNPWEAENMANYYPGDDFVDWVGVTLLNYGPFNEDGKHHTFDALYSPFHEQLQDLTRKPVMLAEFGSVRLDPGQDEWVLDAMNSITNKYEDIAAVVLFNSAHDQNIPANDWYSKKTIDWTLDPIGSISNLMEREPIVTTFATNNEFERRTSGALPELQSSRGVRYNKGKDWQDNYYTLTRQELIKDLEAIKKFGVNTIYYPGGNIYDYNFLSYSKKYDLEVIYQFNLDHTISYLNHPKELEKIKKKIIKKVQSLKEHEHIRGYSFNYDLENYFHKPLLHYERSAFINWLGEVLEDIQDIDSQKQIIVELTASKDLKSHINQLKTLPADAFGLIIQEESQVERAIHVMETEEFPILLSSVPAGVMAAHINQLNGKSIFLENWQDERKTNQLVMTGLVDFKGRKTEDYHVISNVWNNNSVSNLEIINPSILKPAALLYADKDYVFQAVLFENGRWEQASMREGDDLEFEWYLVKTDDYGNSLAVKEIGKGTSIEITIPENYKNYELLLVTKNIPLEYVISRRSTLHTPIN